MKLLFDENRSYRLVQAIADINPAHHMFGTLDPWAQRITVFGGMQRNKGLC